MTRKTLPMRRFARYATALVAAVLPTACDTSSGGGGGGGGANADPLPEFKLGQDAQLDADIAAMVAADNASAECLGSDRQFTDQDSLSGLKGAYVDNPGLAPSFPEFVEDAATIQSLKRDQICDLNMGDDADLDAAIQRITDAANRYAECRSDDAVATTDQILVIIKALFFEAPLSTLDLVAFSEETADRKEQDADDECADDSGG